MREEGVQPSLVTYNSLIHAHAKQAAGLERVSGYKRGGATEKRQCSRSQCSAVECNAVLPSLVMYNSLIHAHAKSRQLDWRG